MATQVHPARPGRSQVLSWPQCTEQRARQQQPALHLAPACLACQCTAATTPSGRTHVRTVTAAPLLCGARDGLLEAPLVIWPTSAMRADCAMQLVLYWSVTLGGLAGGPAAQHAPHQRAQQKQRQRRQQGETSSSQLQQMGRQQAGLIPLHGSSTTTTTLTLSNSAVHGVSPRCSHSSNTHSSSGPPQCTQAGSEQWWVVVQKHVQARPTCVLQRQHRQQRLLLLRLS
mmetsp:Transcript_8739/g.18625  ORF Transcript_8739/g.18625 Transcript_8739/m.18625 type:complete len:228 (+) Transcript_8739:1320-2003(+)